MIKLAKGPLKVIHINRRAIEENEVRTRAANAAGPRRLVPVVSVWSLVGKTEGFAIRIKGTVDIKYDVMRNPLPVQLGHAGVRVRLETTEAVEVAEMVGEFDMSDTAH